MNLAEISPEVIVARGEYATVNGEYKTTMSFMQELTQKAVDDLRHALQDEVNRRHHLEHAGKLLGSLTDLDAQAAELKAQKDALWAAAWGKK